MPAETKQAFTPSDIKAIVEEYIKNHLTVDVELSTYKGNIEGVTVHLQIDGTPFSSINKEVPSSSWND